MARKRPQKVVGESLLAGLERFDQLQLMVSDPAQERYEAARPLLLGQPLTAIQRA